MNDHGSIYCKKSVEGALAAHGRGGEAFGRTVLICAMVSLAVLVGIVFLQNLAIQIFFPHLVRLDRDFSPAYLQREVSYIAATRPSVIVFGDSVLWGYYLRPQGAAVSIMRADGCICVNLAFRGSGPPNYYALLRLLSNSGIHPKTLILEINQAALSPGSVGYNTLNPSLAALALPLLDQRDRALLARSGASNEIAPELERMSARYWLLYAMRTEVRDMLFGERDAEVIRRPKAEDFAGAYDLTALSTKNVGVHFLQETIDLLRASHTPAVAFMTPVNHTLLRDYVDTPGYRENGAFLTRLLNRGGVRVVNLDATFGASDFIDNDHLTSAAQSRLAHILEESLKDDGA